MSVPGNLYTPTIRKTRGADYLIEQSLLFNDNDSAYLSRTPSTAGNRKTWTFSVWFKRAGGTDPQILLSVSGDGTTNEETRIIISSNQVQVVHRTGSVNELLYQSDAVFRDYGAWYHLSVLYDSTQASGQVRAFANGTELTWGTSTDYTQNHDSYVNATCVHQIGKRVGAAQYFDGLMALPILVDGAALDATSFGEEDDDGYWNPIEFTGTTTTQLGSNQVPDMTGASTPSGTASASANEGGEEPWKAFDRDNVTYWGIIGTAGWVQYDFGASNEQTITSYRIYADWRTVGAGYGTGPDDWTLEASNTGAFAGEETVLDTVTGEIDGTALSYKTFTFSNSTAYRYYRLDITNNGGNSRLHIQELEFISASVSTSDSYGTNGVVLDFADTADFGTDVSGNGNDYTPNNFTAADQLSDTPTDSTDNETGNFATWNALTSTPNATFADGNLDVTSIQEGAHRLVAGTIGVSSGKWYWEVTIAAAPNVDSIGVVSLDLMKDGVSAYLPTYGAGWGYSTSIGRWDAGGGWVSAAPAPPALTSSGVIGIALDLDNDKMWFRNAGGWINSGDPVAGTTPNFTNTGTNGNWTPGVSRYNNAGTYTLNCGQKAFTYTPPTGFETNFATQNLPAPTIADGSDYFNTLLYTGNGTAIGSGGNAITGVGFQPDFVWIKNRDQADNHHAFDVVRGATIKLEPNTTNAEGTNTEQLNSFDADGFTLGNAGVVNTNTENYVAWCWKAGGAAVTNSTFSITSQVSVNTTSGFSIVTYTAPASPSTVETVGHGLGAVPGMMIWKNRTDATDWYVWHKDLAANNNLKLNSTAAQTNDGVIVGNPPASAGHFNTFGALHTANKDYVAYCWAEVEGFSKFGSHTGNGNADGPFINTGFKPAWIMIKEASSAGNNWFIWDNKRSPYNAVNDALQPTNNAAELVDNATIATDFVSNGFKIRGTSAAFNTSGSTYIYAAFAENPFQGDDGYTQARAR